MSIRPLQMLAVMDLLSNSTCFGPLQGKVWSRSLQRDLTTKLFFLVISGYFRLLDFRLCPRGRCGVVLLEPKHHFCRSMLV
jgi:hypothetical protein